MHQQTSNRCINCGLRLTHMRRRTISEVGENIVSSVINFWIWPAKAQPNDSICISCWELAQSAYEHENEENQPPERQIGHRHVCILCGRSVQRLDHRTVLRHNATIVEQRIVHEIANRIHPRQINVSDECCLACWMSAKRAMLRQNNEPNYTTAPELIDNININEVAAEENVAEVTQEPAAGQHERFINLPNIRRGTVTTRQCLFRDCPNPERLRVSEEMRQRVLKEYNYFIPMEVRVCRYHFDNDLYHELYTAPESVNYFTAEQIEEMIFILSQSTNIFNEDIQTYPEHLVHYFIGITKEQHAHILERTPRLSTMHRGSFALTALLCKLRTGDSGDRLSSLFQVPRRTMESLMSKARQILTEDFVPQYLGLGHIDRQMVASRNSLLADGLFGEPEASAETKPAIVIADGTYLYTQKSSNYLFQKDTYSLHKYRNLIKPFLIVCCDGHILDVFGPYSATTNDANIMKSLLNDDFLSFFNQNDVFILDRGFRDCMDDLHDKGFIAHMPECLETGQRQLTTLQGNISRCITMNRWVVEAVNGRFKRDFKIFRHEYFNRAATHAMADFRLAAAIINCFTTPYRDSENAATYLNITAERMFINNDLAEIVQAENLNMRGGLFLPVDTEEFVFPELSMQDLTLFSCGVYQIKQAKSYIGEHFRWFGIFGFI